MRFSKFVISPDTIQVPVNNYVAVYHRELGALCMLNSKSLEILNKFRNPQLISKEILENPVTREDELIQQLVLRNLLCLREKHDNQAPSLEIKKKVNVIQLILANSCNFGCTYCFEGIQGKEMSVEKEVTKIDLSRLKNKNEIKINLNDSMYSSKARFEHQYDPKNRLMKPENAIEYVQKAIEVVRSSGENEIMIQFFGGEPFLNWKAINAVLESFGNGSKFGVHIYYSTVTNGSLLNDEIAAKLAANKVAVCVSIDSPKSSSRPLKNGDNSMPIVMQGLYMLKKHKNRVALNAALTSSTWHEFDESVVDLAVEVGAKEIGVVVDFDPTFYSIFGTENIVNKLWQVIEYGRSRGVVLTGYWHQIFQIMLGFNVVEQRGFKNCSAKGAQFSIEPNGSVFSCKAGSTLMGHISQGSMILENSSYTQHAKLRERNPKFCDGCEIEGFCGGLCLGPLEKKYASIDSVEPSACDFYRGITTKHIQSLRPFEIATFEL